MICQNSASMRRGAIYELSTFHDGYLSYKIGPDFPRSPGGRALPNFREISQEPTMAAMFRLLLRDGQISEGGHPNFDHTIQRAHKLGCIYAKEFSSFEEGFVFPTPLHTAALSWVLVPLPSEANLPSKLLDLVSDVVARFNYSQLTHSLRRVGDDDKASGSQEAQYQDEFYRALHDCTKGGVQVSPDFATAANAFKAGCIDFFIAEKKWGIEITQDGRKLQEHSDRFGGHGAYGHWIETGEMSDYILLDCRSTVPLKRHSCRSSFFFIDGN